MKKKEILQKVSGSLLQTWLWDNSDSACANKATGFSVDGSSTLNGLFQTINR